MSLMGRVEADGLVTIYATDTGAAVRRWPVDAAELLAGDGWSVEPPAPVEVAAPDASAESADAPAKKAKK